MDPEAGQTVGSVVLRSKIADGGMATVWAAEHVALNREVAVKFLHERSRADQSAVRRFALEARTIARISSPHVPQVFDHGVAADGTPYIVMEHVTGVDLREWVAQWGCLDLAQAVRLVEHMSLALGAAHELGIVHRDVKPENMILSSDSSEFCAKLVDFGIAKSTGLALSTASLTLPGMLIGTPCYMSPEQLANASHVDERSDVWSLGVVTYWALTGRLPFKADTFAEAVQALAHPHFTPPSELRADLPPELDVWFGKVLNVDVNARVPSVDLMNRMLKVAVANPATWTRAMPVVALPSPQPVDIESFNGERSLVPTLESMRRTRRRRASVNSAMGAAVVGALLLAKFGLVSPTTAWSSDARVVAPHAALEPGPAVVAAAPPVLSTAAPVLAAIAPPGHDLASLSLATPQASPPPPRHEAVATRASRKALPAARRTVVTGRSSVAPAVASSAPVALAADAGAAPPDPSSWTPRDDLGEP